MNADRRPFNRPPRASLLGVFLAALLVLGSAASAPAAEDAARETAQRIESLVAQLGDEEFFVRERAQEELTRIGFEAFDALAEAETHVDIEIASRAKYLLKLMRIDWTRETDPPEVKRLLKDYETLDDRVRFERMKELAQLPDDAGLSALCRLVRFEKSTVLSKLAAVQVIQKSIPTGADPRERGKRIEDALSRSPRPAAQWLRVYAAVEDDAGQAIQRWSALTQAEEKVLAESPEQSQNEILLAMLRHQVKLLEAGDRQDEALAAMRKMIPLARGDSESLTRLVEWLVERQAWSIIDELAERFGDRFSQDPLLLYTLAQARAVQGKTDLAEEAATRARAINASNLSLHRIIAFMLRYRGMIEWSKQEYQFVIDSGQPQEANTIASRWLLAELLHDQEDELAAAQQLEAAAAAMELNIKNNRPEQNSERDPAAILARMHYFYGNHFGTVGDKAKQLEHLEQGIKHDPLDADVLIALYRLPEQTAERRRKTLDMIQTAAAEFRRQVEEAAEESAKATACNQFAWLVGNTEGDQAEALRLSQLSVQLQEEMEEFEDEGANALRRELAAIERNSRIAGYLDTLGRCFYASGDLANAVKHQSRAVDLDPHSGQMRRQLELFQAELAKVGTTPSEAPKQ